MTCPYKQTEYNIAPEDLVAQVHTDYAPGIDAARRRVSSRSWPMNIFSRRNEQIIESRLSVVGWRQEREQQCMCMGSCPLLIDVCLQLWQDTLGRLNVKKMPHLYTCLLRKLLPFTPSWFQWQASTHTMAVDLELRIRPRHCCFHIIGLAPLESWRARIVEIYSLKPSMLHGKHS